MFGYIVPNYPELKVKELEEYRSWYCGLCQILLRDYGIAGQVSLSYDMTFLAMLLSGLYDCETTAGKCRCVRHPGKNIRSSRINMYSMQLI